MGRRGPKPTPTEKLGSNWRRKARKGEVKVKAGMPAPPGRLCTEGKAVWRRVAAILGKLRMGSEADAAVIERYCALTVEWRKCAEDVRVNGATFEIRDKRKTPGTTGLEKGHFRLLASKARAEATLMRQLNAELLRIEVQFGLTAAARIGLKAEHKEDEVVPAGKGGAEVIGVHDLFEPRAANG